MLLKDPVSFDLSVETEKQVKRIEEEDDHFKNKIKHVQVKF